MDEAIKTPVFSICESTKKFVSRQPSPLTKLFNFGDFKPVFEAAVRKMDSNSDVTLSERERRYYGQFAKAMTDDVENVDVTLPVYGLPTFLQNLVVEVSDVYQCHQDYVTAGMMAVISTTARKNLILLDGGFFNYPQLWNVIVGRSGTGKTQPIEWLLRPLRAAEAASHSESAACLSDFDKEARAKAMRQNRYIMQDVTIEVRNNLLSTNGKGMMYYNDEIKGYFSDVTRYRHEGGDPYILSIYSNSTGSVDRLQSESFFIREPFMTILGGIQPGLISKTFTQPQYLDNGFTQRFMFAYPITKSKRRKRGRGVSSTTTQGWCQSIEALMGSEQNEGESYEVELSTEAGEMYDDFVNAIRSVAEDTEDDRIEEIVSKIVINCLRFALTVHVARRYFDPTKLDEEMTDEQFKTISGDVMGYSIDCMAYYMTTFCRVLGTEDPNRKMPKISRTDALMTVCESILDKEGKQTALADALGISHQYINKLCQQVKRLKQA